ncbi:MAG: SulP family inorganic anion transporter [Myxococcota bacterium]
MEKLAKFITAATWLREYDQEKFRGDLFAGLTVGVMLIPQSMAYALLAGMPAIYGLYASLVPLFVYPLLGTSRHLAVGLVALDMLIVAAGVGALASMGTDHYIELAILLAVMTGVIEIAMGVFRLGFMVNFLSRPVIAGFMTAAPLIIASSQIGNLLGLELVQAQHFYVLLYDAALKIQDVHFLTVGIGFGSMAILYGLQEWKPEIPASLVIVLMGVGGSWALDLQAMGVDVVGDIPAGLPSLMLPTVSFESIRELLPTAVTLALVQFMSIMSLGKVFAAKHGYSVHANKELIAIGTSNLLGSFLRSIPISGSFSRSAVNETAGAKTPIANVVAAVLIVLTLLFLTPIFYYLPIPVLAAIIIVATIGMVDIPEIQFLLKTKRSDGIVAVITLFATLFIGIQEGILLGIGGSILVILYNLSRPNVAELGHVPGTTEFRDVARNPDAQSIEGIYIVRIDASFTFANAEHVKQRLLDQRRSDGDQFSALIVDARGVNNLDTTSVAMLLDVIEELHERGVDFYIVAAKGKIRDVFRRSGLVGEVGESHFFATPDLAVQEILSSRGEEEAYDAHPEHPQYDYGFRRRLPDDETPNTYITTGEEEDEGEGD